jgi:hypothetical protein
MGLDPAIRRGTLLGSIPQVRLEDNDDDADEACG